MVESGWDGLSKQHRHAFNRRDDRVCGHRDRKWMDLCKSSLDCFIFFSKIGSKLINWDQSWREKVLEVKGEKRRYKTDTQQMWKVT